MNNESCPSGLPSGNFEANVEEPSLPAPNRIPIWRRKAFPPTPARSDDPYEFSSSNLTPAIKRVKSRSKMPSNNSNVMRKAAVFASHVQFHSSTSLVGSSGEESQSVKGDLKSDSTEVEQSAPERSNGNPVEIVASDNTAEKDSRLLKETSLPTSLPPKKPRLSYMRMSSSDIRPVRKPVIIERDFQMPSSSTPLRIPKSVTRHCNITSLRLTPVNNGCDQQAPDDCLIEPPSHLLNGTPPRKLFHSRSSMNLRLTPERDMRDRRLIDIGANTGTPSTLPKSKLYHSATMSDLRETISTPVQRRRSSSTQAEPKKPPVTLRRRSSSVALGEVMVQHSARDEKEKSAPEQLIEKVPHSSLSLPACMDTDVLLVKNNGNDLADSAQVTSAQSCDSESPKKVGGFPECDAVAGEQSGKTSEEEHIAKDSEANISSEPIESYDAVPDDKSSSLRTHEELPTTSANIELEPVVGAEPAEVTMELIIQESRHEINAVNDGQEEPKDNCTAHIDTVSSSATETYSLPTCDDNVSSGNPTVQIAECATFCVCSIEAGSSTQSCRSEIGPASEQLNPDSLPSGVETIPTGSSAGTVKNKSVRFKNVSVYYFARTQGTSTVPKSGEVSLGMVDKHFTKRQFPLWYGRRPELALSHDSEESLSEGEDPGDIFDPEGHERCTAYQLPTLEGKARIKMLKRSGVQVQKDDGLESLESIRKSRLLCGCQCENGICDPETCQCAAEGIVCQVDGIDEFGSSHPCSCTSANCRNPEGRIEFDVSHVKNHCRMTILRTKHAEQTGRYDSPQRIRFNSEGEQISTAQMCSPPNKKAAVSEEVQTTEQDHSQISDDPPTRKFPVTPVYKRSKQRRGLRVELAMGLTENMSGDKVKFPTETLNEYSEDA